MFVKVSEEFGENRCTYNELGLRALYEIATLPQEHRFVKVYEEFGSNGDTWQHIGMRALYEIATMPEEAREQSHTIPSTGETKKPEEFTDTKYATSHKIGIEALYQIATLPPEEHKVDFRYRSTLPNSNPSAV